MTVYTVAGGLLVLVVAIVVVLSIVAGARAEERALRAQGCTCEYPRAGDHVGGCPLRPT